MLMAECSVALSTLTLMSGVNDEILIFVKLFNMTFNYLYVYVYKYYKYDQCFLSVYLCRKT